ncbi:YlcI/YnfO family protein [Tomitella gaofuii]|uniref:YlcI/YnfO family protein n=1 Tax=Tomitella gaofuii TaxID=2760083 RepID=UPI0015F9981A|nr:YlcI/YnfO family protein [Tomitella gaofuii]
MNTKPMTPEQEYDFYAQSENQKPQGPAVRRRPRLSDPVPVRFPPKLLEQIRRAAEADDRSVSAWLRRAAEHELRRPA